MCKEMNFAFRSWRINSLILDESESVIAKEIHLLLVQDANFMINSWEKKLHDQLK